MKIYLAGPEVFIPNARDILDRKAALTRAAGFVPLSPGDLEIPHAETRLEFGMAISQVNESMMLEADAIIANLTPFRGIAADVGTTYELGFMCALEKPAYAYTNISRNHFERTAEYYGGLQTVGEDERSRGPDGLSIEDFDMIDNLMLQGGIQKRGGAVVVGQAQPDALYTDVTAFETCLRMMQQRFLS